MSMPEIPRVPDLNHDSFSITRFQQIALAGKIRAQEACAHNSRPFVRILVKRRKTSGNFLPGETAVAINYTRNKRE